MSGEVERERARDDFWILGSALKRLPRELSEDARAVLIPGALVSVVTRSGEVWAGRVREWVGALRLHPFGAVASRVFAFDDLVDAQVVGPHSWEQRSEVARRQSRGEPARRLKTTPPAAHSRAAAKGETQDGSL